MPDTDSEFLRDMREQFRRDVDDEDKLRRNFAENIRFQAGEQWDERKRLEREKRGLPSYTFNRCHTFVQAIANEARQNKPQIKYIPAEDADADTAEVYEGLARHIQYDSDAQIAYETAVEYSAGGGFGYFRFTTEYADNGDADYLDVKVLPVLDPLAVYGVLTPACFGIEPDHAFVVSEMPKAQFEREYPDSTVTNWELASKGSDGWLGTETVRIAEYWWVVSEKKKANGRTKVTKTVYSLKTNGLEILDDSKAEWPGYCIPIVPVLGKLVMVPKNEGASEPKLLSVIEFQKDAQRLVNNYKSRTAAILELAPVSPYMAVEGQLTGHEKEWAEANNNPVVLQYRAVSLNGAPAPPPQRSVAEPPVMALTNAAQAEIDDMKATTGIYDASLGARGNETTGIAIARRQQQADVTNMHFMDNLERSFKKGGVIIADLLPKVYDAKRQVRILGADEQPKIVKINQPLQDGKHYKIGGDDVAKFDVIVTMGKAFSSKRAETFDTMTQLFQANPQAFLPIAPLMLRNSDMAGADDAAEIMKTVVNAQFPQLAQLEAQKQGKAPEIPPEIQQALQQANQHLQLLNAHAQQLEQENQAYKAGAQVKQMQIEHEEKMKAADIAHQEEMQRQQNELKLALGEIAAASQDANARRQLTADLLGQVESQAHEVGMAAMDHAHEQMSQQAAVAQQQPQNGAGDGSSVSV